ncbi:MAG: pyridoxamine 5'-phosphate oxidase family protein [Candidatus Bathyarchaeota archaeon]|nr:pyridoxamine 5'-phosphate oxidase family protein [Candidatus Bathyarchaeota archaeon]
MNFETCIKFANENPVSFLASIDDKGQPHVRGFLMWYADKTGFYFHTGTMKAVYKQLKANPKVEICFFNNKQKEDGIMMRLAGEVEFVNDLNLKKRLVEERQFLKALGFTAESRELVIFRIYKGEAYFWTMETNFEPKKPIPFG